MAYRVIKGLTSPFDDEKKGARRGVVLHEVGDYLLIAPITSSFEKSGVVHHGEVLLTNKSAAYTSTGLNKPEVLIRVCSAMVIHKESIWLESHTTIGVLNPHKDKRFADNLRDALVRMSPRVIEG